jgi:hypothetical protein
MTAEELMDDAPTTPPDQLINHIRFGLQDLTSRNGQFEFEEACRHLARRRIASNIVPATGPVTAGGDQGRDFESFHTYLRQELGEEGWFAGRASDDTLAFACTLQQEGLPTKIKGDVAKITGSGTQVARVYAFLSADLTVGPRHALIEEVKDEYKVELEVWDGKLIAEQLADHDTFWIAVRYLSLSEHLAPPRPPDGPDLPGWYVEGRQRWQSRGAPRPLVSDFVDLKECLRYATFKPAAREDLPFWLDLMLSLTPADMPPEVRQRARYEVIANTIRGLGDLRSVDGLVVPYLDEAVGDDDPARHSDAANVLSYATAASAYGHSTLEPGVLADRRRALRRRVADLIADDPPRVRRARLLMVRGHLALTPDPESFPRRPAGDPAPSPVPWLDREAPPVMPFEAAELFDPADVAEAAEAWGALAASLEDSPLFPVDDFSRLLRLVTPVLVDEPGWGPMVEAIDAAVARMEGGAAAGAACRDRAMALYEAGRLRLALHELHRAKDEWWSGDTIRGALLSMLMLSQIYADLYLPFAAKQYALAAAGLAYADGSDEIIDFVARGLLRASELSYMAGDWTGAIEELEIGLTALHDLNDPEDPATGEALQHAMVTYGICLRTARDLGLPEVDALEEIGRRLDIYEDVVEVLEEAGPVATDELLKATDEQLLGRPFSDLGAVYEITFAALGTRWIVRTENELRHVLAAQRLAAAAQILLVELADTDLCLMPTAIEVTVQLRADATEASREQPQALPSPVGRQWRIKLAPSSPEAHLDEQAPFVELLATLSHLLLDVAMVPQGDYFAAIHNAFERGLGHKLAAGRPYDDLAAVIPPERWNASGRIERTPPLDRDDAPWREHPELVWQDGPGPTFDEARAVQMAANRYEAIPPRIARTLARLQVDDTFLAVVRDLRTRGWLDWHLLTSAFNIVLNARLDHAGLNTREALETPGAPEAADKLARSPEGEEEPTIDLDLFDAARMETARQGAIPPLLGHWGLRFRPGVPDLGAIQEVLDRRYGYWDIDAPHEDYFPNA